MELKEKVKPVNQLFRIFVLVLLGCGSVMAQSKDQIKNDLIVATEGYKTSTQNLVRLQEETVDKAAQKLEQLRQLVNDGLVARNELEAAEREMAVMREKLVAAKQQVQDADRLISEVRAQEKLEKSRLKAARDTNSKVKLTSLRYTGQGYWTIDRLPQITSFFANKFGRSLPTSAVGQSTTHNQLRWDHRNAVDVALHPDSLEGTALINYLQEQRIPFLAFRSAIPGVATGPHIHIGLPSNRL